MKRFRIVIYLLITFFQGNTFLFAQPIYNDCFHTLEICPNNIISINNIGANRTFCPDCEDDFIFCFSANNTIWLKFTTNSVGGAVQVDFSNLVFENGTGQDNQLQASIFSTIQPCSANTYIQVGNCVTSATTNFALTALSLAPNTTYYIVVNGDKTGAGISMAAECTFNVLISGVGVDRIVPSISLVASSQTICKNDVVNFSASLINCPDSSIFEWSVNGVLVATTVDTFYQTSTLNTGDVVTVSNICFTLCPQLIKTTIGPFSVYSFAINAGPDEQIALGDAVILQGSTTAPIYTWSPDFLLTDNSILNPVANPTETTTYTLSATENGCTLFDDVTIFIQQELVIPTTFSPNNDGINDVFEITGIENYPNCLLVIYDRWGQEVFQKTGYSYSKAWKGEVHEKELASSVYFYVLELRDKDKQIKKGSITLIH